MKKIVSLLLSAAMIFSALPVTFAAKTQDTKSADTASENYELIAKEPQYTKAFNGSKDDVKAEITGQKNGWSIKGDNHSIDVGDFNTGSQAIRFSNVNWGTSNSLILDLKTSALAGGMTDEAYTTMMSQNPVVGFQFVMDADFGGFQNGSQTTIQLQDANGKAFMALEAYTKDNGANDITLNLIALNDSKTKNIRYELARGKERVFKIVHSAKVFLNTADNTYQLQIDGETVTAGAHGTWIPASTSAEIGSASHNTALTAGKVMIDNKAANWYGGVAMDTITLANWTKMKYTGMSTAPDSAMSMWYRQPAKRWAESLPLGNGRVGAMIWGDVLNDTVSLNDVTAWSGQDHTAWNLDKDNTGNTVLAQIQEELKKDKPDQSKLSNLLIEWGGKSNEGNGTHRPFGKLDFSFNNVGDTIADYRRSVDLRTAVSEVTYTDGDAKYLREAFVSNPDQVLVMKYGADKTGKVSFDVNFSTEDANGGTGTTTAGADYLEWNGTVHNNSKVTESVKTFAYMKALNTGGTVTYDADGMHVNGADEVVIVVSLGTNFKAGKNFVQNNKENAKAQLDAAKAKTYASLKEAHITDVTALYDRMKFEIGATSALKSADPVDVRLNRIREGGDIDGSFMSLWYQYARYLMIAGSRENSPMPMNLQGIWNDNVACNMAWTCDYHLDINIQMNQWMSNSSNLSESEMPIFDFMENILIPNGEITAKKQYGTKAGWVASIMTNAWGYTGNTGEVGAWHGNTTCGGWLAQEIMNYYSHTQDVEFLRERGYPMLKSTADFYNEYMIEHTDKDGNTYWVTAPSSSPEHGQIEMMSTMDTTVIRDIFEQVLKSYDILGMEHDAYYDTIAGKLAKLQPYKVMPTGNLAEWPYNPADDGNTNHRHTSHLLGLFPYAQITPDKTPDLAKASLVSMQRRFDRSDFEHTEWTAVNAQGQYARLKDSTNAYKYLKLQGDTFTWPNLLSISPEGIALAPCDVYIIDGTFGVGQATAEMLLQSHSDRLEFLPALPQQWSEGNIEGMSAEGGFEVDFSWKDYTLASASITSKTAKTCNILKNSAINWDNVSVYKKDGDSLSAVSYTNGPSLFTFNAEAGATYVLKAKDQTALQTGRMINGTDPRVKVEGFTYNAGRAGAYFEDGHYAEQDGASMEFAFTGTGVDVIAEKDGSNGDIEIFVDGVSKGTVSTNNATMQRQQMIYSINDLAYGNHTIKVVKRSGTYAVLDAFAVRGQYFTVINDDNPMITYSEGWERATNRVEEGGKLFGDYMGDVHYASETGKWLTVDFDGTGIEVLVEKGVPNGKLEFEIDGKKLDSVDITNAPNGNREGASSAYQITGLSNGSHQLKVTNLGKVDTSGWGWATIDGFVILDEGGTALNSGMYQMTNLDSGKLLDVENGELTQTQEYAGGANQKWYLDYVDDVNFRLVNAYSGKVATIADDNGTVIQGPVDATDKKQLWQKIDYTIADGQKLIMNTGLGQYMQINGAYTENGGGVGLWTYEQKEHFRWTFEDAGDNLVFIKNGVGKYLHVEEANAKADGARLLTWSKLLGADQQWKITAIDDDAYTIAHTGTGKQVVSSGGTTALADATGATNEKWTVSQKKQNGVGYYVFTNVEDGGTLKLGSDKWRLAPGSEAGASAPYVYDVKLPSTVTNGTAANVTYKYDSLDKKAEGSSEYNVYVVDTKEDALTTPVASGNTTANTGFAFTLEAFAPEKTLVIEIIPVDADGERGAAICKYITPFVATENLSGNVQVTEDFSKDGMAASIIRGENGWYSGGSTSNERPDYDVSINDKGGKSKALKLSALKWWGEMWTGVKLSNESNEFTPITGKGYFEFDAMFDATNYFDKESEMYIALKNDTTKFGGIRLMGRSLDVVALSSDGGNTRTYNIATGMEDVYGKWFNFKVYIDTDNNQFAVSANGKYVKNDNGGIWFTPSDSNMRLYTAHSTVIGSVTDIEFGHKWMGVDSILWIDNMKTGTYTSSAFDSWAVSYVNTPNDTLVYGQPNDVSIGVVQREEAAGAAILALYQGDNFVGMKGFDNLVFDSRGLCEINTTIDVPKVGGNYTAKVFLWTKDMVPLSNPYVKNYVVDSAFSMSNVFSDNMMLQADKQITLWGGAVAGDTVVAELKDVDADTVVQSVEVVADGSNAWECQLDSREAGGNYVLNVTCGEETKTYSNIIFGDVYVLAGQSNMEAWMGWLQDAKDDLEANKDVANNTNIRAVDLFHKGTDGANEPSENIPPIEGTTWKPMSYSNAQSMSIIGYYFAQKLNKETDRPIGLISTAVGGTGIDRWVTNGSLYNNRIYPIRNLEVSGVLYYQGEADEGRSADEYSTMMADLIDDYRELFSTEDLPFYFAQLARYAGQDFKHIRAAQSWTLDKVTNPVNTGIVSTLDSVGNKGLTENKSGNARHDIHPYGKAAIADRFALFALKDIYKTDVTAHGPMYKSMEIVGSTIELTFDAVGNLKLLGKDIYGDYKTEELITNGDLNPDILNGFEIAGEDGEYKLATATISGNKVIVSNVDVATPVNARYTYAGYAESPNLTDDSGLPSYTFSTEYMTAK